MSLCDVKIRTCTAAWSLEWTTWFVQELQQTHIAQPIHELPHPKAPPIDTGKDGVRALKVHAVFGIHGGAKMAEKHDMLTEDWQMALHLPLAGDVEVDVLARLVLHFV